MIFKSTKQFTFLIAFVLLLFTCISYPKAAEKKTQKNNSKPAMKTDSQKFDELKLADASIWRCEKNIIVKTAVSTNGHLMLWNSKLYVMKKIDALSGVQRYANDVNHLHWVEIPDKGMLFDFKLGQRLLDYCKTPELAANSVMNQEDLLK
jgi:hypothetical protein